MENISKEYDEKKFYIEYRTICPIPPEYLEQLQMDTLDLSNQFLTDISFWREHKNLRELSLRGNEITDISVLAELGDVKEYTSASEIKTMIEQRMQFWKEEKERKKKEIISLIKNPEIIKSGTIFKKYAVAWDCIWLGSYPQTRKEDDTFFIEPICWRVLKVKNGVVTLLSDIILDAVIFNKEQDFESAYRYIKYYITSHLPDFCHTQFYQEVSFCDTAFSEKEREALKYDIVDRTGGLPEGLPGYDYIWPVDYGFHDNGKRIPNSGLSRYSDYAVSKGLRVNGPYGNWLIEPRGYQKMCGLYMDAAGILRYIEKGQMIVGIRPAIAIDLNKLDPVRFESRYVKVTT